MDELRGLMVIDPGKALLARGRSSSGTRRQYILDAYVTPMVAAGRLEMTIPDQPNHPQQNYRVRVSSSNSR